MTSRFPSVGLWLLPAIACELRGPSIVMADSPVRLATTTPQSQRQSTQPSGFDAEESRGGNPLVDLAPQSTSFGTLALRARQHQAAFPQHDPTQPCPRYQSSNLADSSPPNSFAEVSILTSRLHFDEVGGLAGFRLQCAATIPQAAGGLKEPRQSEETSAPHSLRRPRAVLLTAPPHFMGSFIPPGTPPSVSNESRTAGRVGRGAAFRRWSRIQFAEELVSRNLLLLHLSQVKDTLSEQYEQSWFQLCREVHLAMQSCSQFVAVQSTDLKVQKRSTWSPFCVLEFFPMEVH